jgi:translation elongation factor EF-Ts
LPLIWRANFPDTSRAFCLQHTTDETRQQCVVNKIVEGKMKRTIRNHDSSDLSENYDWKILLKAKFLS